MLRTPVNVGDRLWLPGGRWAGGSIWVVEKVSGSGQFTAKQEGGPRTERFTARGKMFGGGYGLAEALTPEREAAVHAAQLAGRTAKRIASDTLRHRVCAMRDVAALERIAQLLDEIEQLTSTEEEKP